MGLPKQRSYLAEELSRLPLKRLFINGLRCMRPRGIFPCAGSLAPDHHHGFRNLNMTLHAGGNGEENRAGLPRPGGSSGFNTPKGGRTHRFSWKPEHIPFHPVPDATRMVTPDLARDSGKPSRNERTRVGFKFNDASRLNTRRHRAERIPPAPVRRTDPPRPEWLRAGQIPRPGPGSSAHCPRLRSRVPRCG